MESVTVVLLLLLGVVVSSILSKINPLPVPTPLVQILLGAIFGMATGIKVELEPDLFFLLFLPPLLFLDGWRIPKEELFRDWTVILELALGLVFVTVLGAGYLIHSIIPGMTLAVAFALASVLSPTDPIAVSAIASRIRMPKRMMHILEGESMFNDASGLVCLRFAIMASVTGTFSPSQALLEFLSLAIVGVSVGVITTLGVSRIKSWISSRYGEDAGTQILISLLIPFGAYQFAEHLHGSGILAAVSAGVTMGYAETSWQALPQTRMRRNSVWDTIQFAGNGVIFVLLGEQLPDILSVAATTIRTTGHQSAWWLLAYVVGITAILLALRFMWVWTSFRLTLLRRGKEERSRSPDVKIVAAMTFSGVRGAITLAGILTLPIKGMGGADLPGRDLAILVAAGVILLSLVLATIALPILLRGLTLPSEDPALAMEDRARVATAKAALAAIERKRHRMAEANEGDETYERVAERVGALYHERIEARSREGDAARTERKAERMERGFRIAAVKAQRDEVNRMLRNREIGSALAGRLTRELDLLELRYRDAED